MIGTMLGDYRIERELGRGGMGTVYAAEDQNLGRKVAIKVISASMGNDPDLVERFRKEAKALARLQHPSVVLVHSFFQHEGSWVLVMEMVEGEQLDLHLKSTGALPWTRAVDLGIALLDGLHHAHVQGVVHRDVKTSNCLLTADGGVKLVDFGIALVEGEGRLTRRGHVVGTPHYIAPEQVSGRPADPRTDLYSLGVVLYEMVTGRVPFDADSEFELLRAHLETAPVSPRAQVPSVPDWLEAVILRAMAKDPADRFADAAAMAEALRQGLSTAIPATRLAAAAMPGPTTVLPSTPAGGMPLAGAPAAGTPAAGVPATGTPTADHKSLVPKLTAALIALALVVVAVAFLWPSKEEPEPPVQAQFLEGPPGDPAAAVSAAPPPEPLQIRIRSQEPEGGSVGEPTTDTSPGATPKPTTSKPKSTRPSPPKTQTAGSTPKPAETPRPAPPPPPPKKSPAERMDELGEIIELLPKRVEQFHEEYDDLRDEVERRLGERREDDLHDQVEDLEDAADDLRKLYRKRVARNRGGTSSDRNQVVQEARRFQSMTRDIQSAAREMQWGSRHYGWTSLQKDLNRLSGIL